MLQLFLALIDEETEKEKFESLYYRYRNLMYYIAAGILKDENLAEDAVQEAFFRVARNFHKVGDVESVRTKNFLALITRNVALTMAKAAGKEPNPADLDKETGTPEGRRGKTERPVSDAAFDAVSAAELRTKILNLPETYRNVLYLAGVYEYSLTEIASLLDLPLETVKKRMQRGRRLLREALDQDMEGNERKEVDCL